MRVSDDSLKNVAPALSYLLAPVAMTGYALALWRLGADLKWTGDFFIADGVFSKWQVWLALAAATQVTAQRLNGLSRRSGDATGT